MIYTYNINLAERGEFYADIRDENEKTVFEIRTDIDTGEIPEIDCGFMRDTNDICGLKEFLQSIGILSQFDKLITAH
jgi:hypothetical protein